jgi:hypothetical protein
MTLLFKRNVKVNIIAGGIVVMPIPDLRIDFDVTLTSESEPNHAEIKIFNLSETSFTTIQTAHTVLTPSKLQILAGYGVTSELIFFGDVIRFKRSRIAGGSVTEIEALDGYVKLNRATYDVTWPKGTPIQTILMSICATIGIPFDPSFVPLTFVLTKALTFSSTIPKILNRLGKAYGFTWSVQRGILEIANEGSPLLSATSQIVTLSPDTGLVGSPEIIMDDSPKKGDPIGSFTATSLLNAKLLPRRPVKVLPTFPMSFAGMSINKAKKKTGFNVSAKGVYVIGTVRHSGSNRTGQFHSEITCPIMGAV